MKVGVHTPTVAGIAVAVRPIHLAQKFSILVKYRHHTRKQQENNKRCHIAGHGPATAKLFMDLWNTKQ